MVPDLCIANAMGVLTQAWPVIIPPAPGVLCAYGDASTQVQDEVSRTYIRRAEDVNKDALIADLLELQARAGESLIADGISASDHAVSCQADLRYVGQAFQITLAFSEAEIREQGVDLITGQFDDEHEQLFTFKLADGHKIHVVIFSQGINVAWSLR